MKTAPSVFLSHSSRDKIAVKRLATDLDARGVNVWLDEWEIKVGESIPMRIAEGVENADYIAVAYMTIHTSS